MMVEGPFKEFGDLFSEPEIKLEFDALKKEVRSLRRAMNLATRRLGDLEVMGFQDQITALDAKVQNVESWIRYNRTIVCNTNIKLGTLWMIYYLGEEMRLNPAIKGKADVCIRVAREIAIELLHRLPSAEDPESLVGELDNRCKPTFMENGFGSFFAP